MGKRWCTTLMVFQLFNVFNARSDERSAFHGLFHNQWLWGHLASPRALLIVAVVYVPFLQKGFSTVALGWTDWMRCVAVASSVIWVREISKLVARAGNGEKRDEDSVVPECSSSSLTVVYFIEHRRLHQ